MIHFVCLFVVFPHQVAQDEGAVLIVLILLIGLQGKSTLGLSQRIDMSGHVVLGGGEPVGLDAFLQAFVVGIGVINHFNAFHQQELMQGGDIGRPQVIASDDAWQGGNGNLFERLGPSKAFLNEFGDLLVELLTIPLAHVGRCLFDGVVAVTPAGVAVPIALINRCLEMI